MPIALVSMYLVGIAVGLASFLVSRGPDGKFIVSCIAFAAIALTYLSLAWATRHDAIWSHVGVHLVLFCTAAAVGMMPKPHLDGMAGMLYMLIPTAVVATVAGACVIRLLGRWI